MNRLTTCAVLGACLLVAARSAAGQTRFVPDPPTAYEQYTSPGQCLAAVERVQDSVWRGQRRDTMPYDPQESAPAAAIAVSRRCAGRFATDAAVEAMDPRDLPTLLRLFLTVGDSAAAERVVQRRAHKASAGTARAEVLFDAVVATLDARPARLGMARRWLARIDSLGLGPTAVDLRLGGYARLYLAARARLDTATMRSATASWFAAVATLPDSVQPQAKAAGFVIAGKDLVLLDAYGNGATALDPDEWLRRLREEVHRRAPLAEPLLKIGRPAPPLGGDFWFGRRDSAEVRPAPGRWSLLVYVGHSCANICYPGYAILRRLQRRLGSAVDITLIDQTRGYFGDQPPPTPAEEAEMIRHYLLDELGLRGPLSVTTTPFVRRPAPDGRRVDRGIPNRLNYGYSERIGGIEALLVDPRGRVVYETGLVSREEAMLNFVLRAMLGPHEGRV